MLKLIYSMAELDVEQLLAVYFGECTESDDFSQLLRRQKDEDTFLAYLRESFFGVKGAFYAAWVIDGVYKTVLRMEPYRDGLLLEGLETAPTERRKGYAACLTAAVLRHLRNGNTLVVYSHVNKRNAASLAVHKKCGFRQISESAAMIDGTVTQNFCTMCAYL